MTRTIKVMNSVYLHTQQPTHTEACMYAHTHTHACTHTHKHTQACMHTVSWMLSFSRGVPCWVAPGAFSCKSDPYNQSNELRVFTHSPSYTHMSTYVHTHTHTCMHTVLWTPSFSRGGWLVGLLLGPCPAKVTHTIKVMNFVYLHTHQPTRT